MLFDFVFINLLWTRRCLKWKAVPFVRANSLVGNALMCSVGALRETRVWVPSFPIPPPSFSHFIYCQLSTFYLYKGNNTKKNKKINAPLCNWFPYVSPTVRECIFIQTIFHFFQTDKWRVKIGLHFCAEQVLRPKPITDPQIHSRSVPKSGPVGSRTSQSILIK